MKKNIILTVIFTAVAIFILTLGFIIFRQTAVKETVQGAKAESPENHKKSIYYCPMHPGFTSDKPGTCPICGMNLVKKENSSERAVKTAKHKIIYYRNPMDPKVTSPVPMKDSMGMDYVPVYEDAAGSSGESGIYLSPEKQQMIGIKKGMVMKRDLVHEIITVGKVAYDPDLYVAQEEYLQALKTTEATKNSVLASVTTQSRSLLDAAEKKLILLGMTKGQIMELSKKGKAQDNLYLPDNENTGWVYMAIYEYEMGLVKEGMPVEIEAVAYPGLKFKGKIAAITPVLDAATRSAQVRVEVDDPDHKLRPEMFVDARIKVDLGERLAIPQEAVLDTGVRKIVYLVKDADMLQAQDVVLGQKAGGFYEVLGGLKEGEMVVTSGNFLVDSESKLKGALPASENEPDGNALAPESPKP